MKSPEYQPRYYRDWAKDKDLISFNVMVKETDLYIRARSDLTKKALAVVKKQRALLERYIIRHPGFATALKPLKTGGDAPSIIRIMAEAGEKAGVGPMAAVAGAIAEIVGKELIEFSPDVIIENGGDVFMKITRSRLVGVYAGESPYTGKIAIRIEPENTPLGVCTSSGIVGHSLSFGEADAAIVLAPSTALADAAATAVCNIVKNESDIPQAIDFARSVAGLSGVAIIKNDKMGVWGDVNLVRRE